MLNILSFSSLPQSQRKEVLGTLRPQVRIGDRPRRHTIRLENSLSIYLRIQVPHCLGYDHMALEAQELELGGQI